MNRKDVVQAIQRTQLFPFAWRSFEVLHPGQRFINSWHVEAMCHALQRVAKGDTRRLIITVPPRYGKSICAAVSLPAWMLGHDPSLKVMVASYGSDLAAKHSRDFRTVLSDPWYAALFPRTQLDQGGNRIDEQITTMQGGRKAISLGGAATGFGADLIVVDDLMKAADATSSTERQRGRDFFEQTLLPRLNDKKTGRIILIQQRLHEDDLPGYLLETGQFEHLNLPAIAVEDGQIPLGLFRRMTRRKGDVLCPEREPHETLMRLQVEMGLSAFSAQYQQDPTPPGGNRIRWEWFGTYDAAYTRSDFLCIVQSWDTAFSAEPSSDFSVGTTWGYLDKKWHLLEVERARLDFNDLKRRVHGAADRWQADTVIIEYAGSGIPLLQQLRREHPFGWRFEGSKPRLDKRMRVEAQSGHLDTGNYVLPAAAAWLQDLRRELLSFPNGRHDDQVDSLIQFVEWSSGRHGPAFVERDPVSGRPKSVNRPKRRHR